MAEQMACEELIELGSVSELTLGDPEQAFYENVTMKDHRD